MGANVVAIEPVRETFERLVRNLVLNHLESSSIALNVGLGAESGFLNMTSALDTTNQIVLGATQMDTTQVEIKTLDEISMERIPSLIKIDVEGWETEELRGGLNTLQSTRLLGLII